MRYVPLKVLRDTDDPQGFVIDYRAILKEVMRRPLNQERGADIEEMRRSIHVLDAIDAQLGPYLELADEDWQYLLQKLDVMPWRVIDRRILDMVDAVKQAGQSRPEQNGLVQADAVLQEALSERT